MTIKEVFEQTGSLGNVFAVDHHMHCGPVGAFRTENNFSLVEAELDRLGINVGIVSDINTYDDVFMGNEFVESIAKASNGRIFGQIFLKASTPMGFEKEIEKRCQSGVFTGIKLHPAWEARDIDDTFFRTVCGIAGEIGYPVLFHTWGIRDMNLMENMAKMFPKTVMFIGHCGGELDASLRAAELAAQYDNLYLDFTCSWGYANLLEHFVKTASAEKILFGSDALWNSVTASLGRVLYADIDDAAKKLILGGNAARLYPKLHV